MFTMIHFSTGWISTTAAAALDYDSSQSLYTLIVQVADQGTPAHSSTCLAQIQLNDINDNTPQFTNGDFTVSITENQASGTSVVLIYAEDADSLANSAMTMTLNHDAVSDPSSHFALVQTASQDTAIGQINTNHILDRETDAE